MVPALRSSADQHDALLTQMLSVAHIAGEKLAHGCVGTTKAIVDMQRQLVFEIGVTDGWYRNVNFLLTEPDSSGRINDIGDFDVMFTAPPNTFLWHRIIDEAHRRQGHASRMLAAIETFMRRQPRDVVNVLTAWAETREILGLLLANGFTGAPSPINQHVIHCNKSL